MVTSNVTVDSSSTVYLLCLVHGYPLPASVTWQFNGTSISNFTSCRVNKKCWLCGDFKRVIKPPGPQGERESIIIMRVRKRLCVCGGGGGGGGGARRG